MSGKRKDYISFDTFFMLCALIASQRSKDPRTQVGAVLVKDDYIKAIGYNGTPRGMNDDEMPWDSLGEETGDVLQIKNSFVVHAEADLLDHLPKDFNPEGSTIYVTLFPCNECAKRIVNLGIKKVVYLKDYKKGSNSDIISHKLFEMASVEVEKFENFDEIDNCFNNIALSIDNAINTNGKKRIRKNNSN